MENGTEIEWTPERISRFWDYQSKRPSAKFNYFSTSHGRHIADRTLRFVKRSRATKILDLGCGTGHFLVHLARARPGLLLHGVDFSEDSVTQSRETTRTIVPPPVLSVVSGYPTLLDSESFDAVYTIEVVEHLSDEVLASLVDEAHRLLKKGGLFFVTTPNRENLELLHTCCPDCGATFHIWQHVRAWSTVTLAKFMAQHGFEEVMATETLLESTLARAFFWGARKIGLVKRPPPHILGVFRK